MKKGMERETLGERVKRLREEQRISQAELAKRVGKAQQTIQALESGRHRSPGYIVSLAEVLGVTPHYLATGLDDKIKEELPVNVLRVEGTVEAGSFRDISHLNDDLSERESIPVAKDGRFPMAHQYALRVSGDSMNLIFPAGSYVTCVSWADTGLEWRDGMIVHVERYRAGLVETTVKALQLIGGAPRFLLPRSTNTLHKPIEINGTEETEIIIKGLVTGKWERVVY